MTIFFAGTGFLGIVCITILLMVVLDARDRRLERLLPPDLTTCDCDHSIAFHDKSGCHEIDERGKCYCRGFVCAADELTVIQRIQELTGKDADDEH